MYEAKISEDRSGAVVAKLAKTAYVQIMLEPVNNDPHHRIKDDRMENSIKGLRIWHCGFAASIILCSTPT